MEKREESEVHSVNWAEKLIIPVGVLFSWMSFPDKAHFASFIISFFIDTQNIN